MIKSEFAVSGFKKRKRGPRANKGKCYLRGGTFKFGFCFFAHLRHSKFLCTLFINQAMCCCGSTSGAFLVHFSYPQDRRKNSI